jgi:alpha-pyrone synthase
MTKLQHSVNHSPSSRGLSPIDCTSQRARVSIITPRITAIATAAPDHDIHKAFIDWADAKLEGRTDKALFARMAKRAGIDHRYSVLPIGPGGESPVEAGGFYAGRALPTTAERMLSYASLAPPLAAQAVRGLGDDFDPQTITHLIVASCTGFVAPGIDQLLAARLGLSASVERLLIGFMGCYAAVTALRTARHIVRSEPGARVLVITVELSTLHLQGSTEIESLLAMLHFGDGAAAALISAEGPGLALEDGISAALPQSEDLIRWAIGDEGFAMHLSGEVPARIEAALADPGFQKRICGAASVGDINTWAVHAGGRSILDAVERGLSLSSDALAASRETLLRYGNMSSSTLMFTLANLFAARPEAGVALAFGPGLAAEGFRFGWTSGNA